MNIRQITLQNQQIPAEGSIAISIGPIDLSNATGLPAYIIDLSQYEWQGRISMVQTLFIDASTSGVPIAITDQNSGQTIVANPHTQGYYNFLSQNPTVINILGPGGPSNFEIFVLNIPIPGAVWAATHP